jgi:hypothetical protein
MCGIKIIQRLFRGRLNRATAHTLDQLRQASHRHRDQLSSELTHLNAGPGPAISFGTTDWGQPVVLPLDKVAAHSLILGASGAGKSYAALSLVLQILSDPSILDVTSIGILDPKNELFGKLTQFLYACLYRLPASERERLKQRIVIIDLADDGLIAPYNILARREYLSDELMVANRIDTISEQFSGLSEVSVRMKMILKYALFAFGRV